MAGEQVTVEGLSELRIALRQAGKNLPRALTRAHKAIATVIADEARPLSVTRSGKPTPSSRTIKGSASQTGASIVASGPTAFGDEFGGGRRARTRQFRPHLGTVGYAIYPTIRKHRDFIETTLLDEIADQIARDAFPD